MVKVCHSQNGLVLLRLVFLPSTLVVAEEAIGVILEPLVVALAVVETAVQTLRLELPEPRTPAVAVGVEGQTPLPVVLVVQES